MRPETWHALEEAQNRLNERRRRVQVVLDARDAAIVDAVAAGATWREVSTVTGLSRAMIDRIVRSRR